MGPSSRRSSPYAAYGFLRLDWSFELQLSVVFGIRLSRAGIQIGDFFSGSKFSLNNELKYRIQPYFNTSIKINFDSIKLPKPHTSKDIWLISPKFQFTPNKKISWTTYIQYSNQSENLGINSRLNWRFAPLSDLYLVYNDNYFYTNSFEPQFRSINLKLTYWINI